MIEKITAYRASDGEYFENLERAVSYQKEIDQEALLRKWVDDNFGGVTVSSAAEYAPDGMVVPLWMLVSFISMNGVFLDAVKKHMAAAHSNIIKLLPEHE